MKVAMTELYEVSYYLRDGKMEDILVFPSKFAVDLSLITEHFKTIQTDVCQDDEVYMLVMDTRPEWIGDIYARRVYPEGPYTYLAEVQKGVAK